MEAEDWDRLFATRERLLPREPSPLVVELVSALPPGRALELGAGEGRHAIWLARHGWRVTAVDFSPLALRRARRRAAAAGLRIDWRLADALDAAAPGAFDLVLIAYMHPPPPRRAATLAAAAAAVADGGHLLAVGLDRADPAAAPEDDWRYTPALLADAFPGLELLRCESVPRDAGASVDTLAWGRRPAPG